MNLKRCSKNNNNHPLTPQSTFLHAYVPLFYWIIFCLYKQLDLIIFFIEMRVIRNVENMLCFFFFYLQGVLKIPTKVGVCCVVLCSLNWLKLGWDITWRHIITPHETSQFNFNIMPTSHTFALSTSSHLPLLLSPIPLHIIWRFQVEIILRLKVIRSFKFSIIFIFESF